eukprot:Gregarina_sp_Poly_1__2045@NODE_1538_length_3900_cov_91_335247_g1015_i0_p4_GENE_NODE_1538_length_3900_cov_91_335247_g1015_i0NODE_1538_length_3900_cov_91_335247_g1015_i0_p4_ORF_typecomplete_len114_score13_13_NODE_1538_length_3900_cov_91_335247_g1015_i0624965
MVPHEKIRSLENETPRRSKGLQSNLDETGKMCTLWHRVFSHLEDVAFLHSLWIGYSNPVSNSQSSTGYIEITFLESGFVIPLNAKLLRVTGLLECVPHCIIHQNTLVLQRSFR